MPVHYNSAGGSIPPALLIVYKQSMSAYSVRLAEFFITQRI